MRGEIHGNLTKTKGMNYSLRFISQKMEYFIQVFCLILTQGSTYTVQKYKNKKLFKLGYVYYEYVLAKSMLYIDGNVE